MFVKNLNSYLKIFSCRNTNKKSESGKIGYFIMWLMGAPVGLLLVIWVILGNSIFGPG